MRAKAMPADRPSTSFKFRGGCFHALVLKPENPLSSWLADVDALLARSPAFFAKKSVVIDISELSLTRQNFLDLLDELKKREIRILGVEGANKLDLDGRIPFLTRPLADKVESSEIPVPAPTSSPTGSLLIESPVRSGQLVVCPDGDVTIVGPVASGAEIIAAGSVHVYGRLRGRVLAGAYGNQHARIFCHRLEAELIAIDGHYIVADEIEPELRQAPVKAWLDGEALKIATMA
jgi:septum site-determining protein MinC